MRPRLAIRLFVLAMPLALAVPLAAQQTVTIGTVGIDPFGIFSTNNTFGSIGQTFQAPKGVKILDYFKIYISDVRCPLCTDPTWTPSLIVREVDPEIWSAPLSPAFGLPPGNTLYTSPGSTPATAGWLEFSGINLTVQPDHLYSAMITWGGPFDFLVSAPFVPDDAYAAGSTFQCGPCTRVGIGDPFETGDALFEAQFSRGPATTVTPEPLTMTLLGTGLAGIAAARRKRKKEAQLL